MAEIGFPPDCWTADPEDLDYGFWAADDSEGQLRARKAGLQTAVPIMITTPESFKLVGSFISGIWSRMGFGKVNASPDLKTVIELLVTKGDRGLISKEVRKW